MFWHNFVIPTLTKTKIFSGQQTKPQIPNSCLRDEANPICPTHPAHQDNIPALPAAARRGCWRTCASTWGQSCSSWKTQHSGNRRSREACAKQREGHCTQHSLHRAELHTTSHPTGQPPPSNVAQQVILLGLVILCTAKIHTEGWQKVAVGVWQCHVPARLRDTLSGCWDVGFLNWGFTALRAVHFTVKVLF